jgi:hypothetical protein
VQPPSAQATDLDNEVEFVESPHATSQAVPSSDDSVHDGPSQAVPSGNDSVHDGLSQQQPPALIPPDPQDIVMEDNLRPFAPDQQLTSSQHSNMTEVGMPDSAVEDQAMQSGKRHQRL